MNEDQNKFFASTRPLKLFFIVALPGLVSMLAASLYSAFEGGFVGQIIGESAFAAVNIAMPFVMINFSLADLIGVGSAVHISVALGRGDNKRANNIFTSSLIMIFLMGILTGLFLYFASPFMTELIVGRGESVVDEEKILLVKNAVDYVRIFAILSPVTTLVFATDNYLRISGFVKGSMFLNIFMSALTVGFLALYLIVLKFDIRGSALASCSAMFICAIIALIPFLRGKAVLKFTRPHFSFRMIWQIAVSGLPIFLNNVAGRVTAIIMNVALMNEAIGGGETAVAAYAVLMYSSSIVEPMLYGLCDSVQPAVGYNWGAKSLDRVKAITKRSILFCGIISIASTAVMVLFPQLFTLIFVDAENAALREMSLHALPLFGTAFIFGWFSFSMQGFFSAIEKPIPATILSVSRAFVFPVLLIFALSFMGLDGLWLNYTGTAVLTAIVAVILVIITQKRIKRDIMSPKINTDG